MKFKDLYERGLDRKVNPAVSASDLSEETVHTEIEEYVFTQEIIVNLYNILTIPLLEICQLLPVG